MIFMRTWYYIERTQQNKNFVAFEAHLCYNRVIKQGVIQLSDIQNMKIDYHNRSLEIQLFSAHARYVYS